VPFMAMTIARRETLPDTLADLARPGDCILLMGARDPSLPALAEKIASRLDSANP